MSPTSQFAGVLAKSRIWPIVWLWLTLGLTAWCFWPALSGPFIFDDFPNLENLRHLNEGVTTQSLGQYLVSAKGNPGRPLAMLSFLIEDAGWPSEPRAFKRDNLLMHLLVGLVILGMTTLWAKRLPASGYSQRWAPLLCMTAWLVVPMQLSATMLVVQRMNILSTLFMLLGLWLYTRLIDSDRGSPMARVMAGGASLAAFGVLALLCKENGVLIFAYATALNLTLFRERIAAFPAASRWLLHLGCAAPLLVLAAGLILTWPTLLDNYTTRDFTLYERLITQPRILSDYLFNILVPRIGGQGILHDDYVRSVSLFSPPTTIAALLTLAVALSAALVFRRRSPLFSLAVFWYVGGHLIESSVLPLELYFEHRNYLPMVGPLFALASSALRIPRPYLRLSLVATGLWLALSAGLTRINATVWGHRLLQAQVWLEEHPKSSRAAQWAASAYLDLGDTTRARETLVAARKRIPKSGDLVMQLQLFDCITRGLSEREWEQTREMFHTVTYSQLAPMLLASYFEQLRGGACKGSLDRSKAIGLAEALMDNPKYRNNRPTLSYVNYEMARQAAVDGDLENAIRFLDLAYEYDPFPSIAREQAIYSLRLGRPDDALRYLEKSSSTPLPWIKRQLLDMRAVNAPLVRSAQLMRADMAK